MYVNRSGSNMDGVKQAACDAIERAEDDLFKVSQDIWSHPEENFQEHHAHEALTAFLEKYGFNVEKHFHLPTAFRAVLGDENIGPHVAVLCEYDALPEIGHACGHNLIAEVGVAAALGVKAAFEYLRKPVGKFTVLGTPAEEGGGGKIDLINAGVFNGVDVAMMAHPAPYNVPTIGFLALKTVSVKFLGKAAHASVSPWEGVNALDAAVLCYQSVSCLRQHMKPSWKVHGIITKGGTKPNIIPEETKLEFYIRAPTKVELAVLEKKVHTCFESAATSTGCRAEINWSTRPHLNVVNNMTIADLYRTNAILVGVDFEKYGMQDVSNIPTGSTDMGNVSHVVPSIHPIFYIGSTSVNHTRDFTTASGDPIAQPFTLAQGKALAMTALDILSNPAILDKAKDEFIKTVQPNPE
ncbi:hypothetical protein ACJMK2_029022 [Sinanodonta woodiana]|uniref:Peptidase M20 domain-containing protein 2 n=1 Tax=Sinanodonta woodiana TaxID=1069815 RepID=A0ABD3X8X0_SINWO